MTKDKTKRKRIFSSRITLIILIFLVIFLGKAVWKRYQKSREASEAREMSERKLEGFEEREANLNKKIKKLETKRGVEEKIRENFNVAKKGEGVIVIVDKEKENKNEKNKQKESLWSKILSFFHMKKQMRD